MAIRLITYLLLYWLILFTEEVRDPRQCHMAVPCARWGPQAGYFTSEAAVRTGLPRRGVIAQKGDGRACSNVNPAIACERGRAGSVLPSC